MGPRAERYLWKGSLLPCYLCSTPRGVLPRLFLFGVPKLVFVTLSLLGSLHLAVFQR